MESSKYFNRCFNLTKRLCKIPSVCGTRGEASIAEFLFQYIVTRPEIRNIGAMPEIIEIPGENHKKAILVFLPSKSTMALTHGDGGEGTSAPVFALEHPAVVLMGHFDTVGVDERVSVPVTIMMVVEIGYVSECDEHHDRPERNPRQPSIE